MVISVYKTLFKMKFSACLAARDTTNPSQQSLNQVAEVQLDKNEVIDDKGR